MSDAIKHECGVAFIRLKKPLQYYIDKYGTALWGLHRLQMLMAKQLHRGQDGAGVGVIKLNPNFGQRYIARKRSVNKQAVNDIFSEIAFKFNQYSESQRNDAQFLKDNFAYSGELLLGHLRYGTHGGNSIENLHPFLRQNNWMSMNLVLAGNYNMTNVEEMFQNLIQLGQHPKEKSDNVTMLEKIGHFLDMENLSIFEKYRSQGISDFEISNIIKTELNLENVLKRSFRNTDGGFNMVGMVGHGDAFVIRDPNGIRPSFWCEDDEILVVASERPAIQTALNFKRLEIKELGRGNALIIKRDGVCKEVNIIPKREKLSCSFERIYFSRGSDADIYKERKKLGFLLADTVLKTTKMDFENTVFSYIPNTAATAFYGMIDGIHHQLNIWKTEQITKLENPTFESINAILNVHPRREKILLKDAKMRTFIAQDKGRDHLVGEAYDVTYGLVNNKKDTLVVLDDSVVRGTTLKQSILRILNRLHPKKIIVVSSAPIIKYPDCYGIDMSRFSEFVAFKALLRLLEKTNQNHLLDTVYKEAKLQLENNSSKKENVIQKLYNLFTDEELITQITKIVTPNDFDAEVELIFQTVENLHLACPNDKGDWYFTGNYPTPGGINVVNRAFVYYMEGLTERAY